MRSFSNAMTVTKNASRCQDCVKVAGMVALRQGGPLRLHLCYRARPLSMTPACLASRTSGCRLERHPAHGWQSHADLIGPCESGRPARLISARRS
jgi:hypothetical protein